MKCRNFHEIEVGQLLSPLELQIALADVVATAVATRDFHPVHHDVEYARSLGHPSVFLNILSSNAFVERFVTEWAGSDARLSRVKIKLGAPVYAGDPLIMNGEVIACSEDGGQWIDVAVSGTSPRGMHLSAAVRLVLD